MSTFSLFHLLKILTNVKLFGEAAHLLTVVRGHVFNI